MKRIYLLTVILFTTLILTGCVTKTSPTIAVPKDFAISFSYGMNEYQMNALDTYHGVIQKDLIENGVTSIDYNIKKEDLKKIYSKLCKFRFKEIKNNMSFKNHDVSDEYFTVTPYMYYKIKFTINNEQYTVTGDSTASNLRNKQASNFCKFIVYMKQFIESTKEYKSLPQPEGGYD